MNYKKYIINFDDPNSDNKAIPFKNISHTTHLPQAQAIVDSETIYPRWTNEPELAGEEVIWFGANPWVNGSQYGCVNFEFDINDIVEKKIFYWISPKTEYKNTLCKIFVTNKSLDLPKYDPCKENGPWVIREGGNFYNMKYPLAFLYNDSLYLHSSKGISFTEHHRKHCIRGDKDCPEKKWDKFKAASYFAYWLVSRDLAHKPYLKLTQKEESETLATEDLNSAFLRGQRDIQENVKKYCSFEPPIDTTLFAKSIIA